MPCRLPPSHHLHACLSSSAPPPGPATPLPAYLSTPRPHRILPSCPAPLTPTFSRPQEHTIVIDEPGASVGENAFLEATYPDWEVPRFATLL